MSRPLGADTQSLLSLQATLASQALPRHVPPFLQSLDVMHSTQRREVGSHSNPNGVQSLSDRHEVVAAPPVPAWPPVCPALAPALPPLFPLAPPVPVRPRSPLPALSPQATQTMHRASATDGNR